LVGLFFGSDGLKARSRGSVRKYSPLNEICGTGRKLMPVTWRVPIVPPRIDSFSSVGLGQRQRYSVTMVRGGVAAPLTSIGGDPLFAVPANPGPRTMNYDALFNAGPFSNDGTKLVAMRSNASQDNDLFIVDLTTSGAPAEPVHLPEQVRAGVFRHVRGGFEVPERACALGVDHALGDALAVEVSELLNQVDVLEHHRSALTDG